jgi:hypothetical protein
LLTRQSPEPSQKISLSLSARFERKMNTSPANGYVARHITILMCRAGLCGGALQTRPITRP